MNPVSALGVASSVVQLVDFTHSLVRGTYEIYKSASGHSAASVDLQSITIGLKTLNDDLRLSLDRAASGKELSKSDAELQTLCKNCNVATDELISALEKLKTQKNHSFWDSFGRALLTVWSKKEVEALQKQLDAFRQQISLHIIASVRYIPVTLFDITLTNDILSVKRLITCKLINPPMVNLSPARSKQLRT